MKANSRAKQTVIKGETMLPPAGIFAWYKRELRKLVLAMTSVMTSRIKAEFRALSLDSAVMDETKQERLQKLLNQAEKEFTVLFENKAKELAENLLLREDKYSNISTAKAFEKLRDTIVVRPAALSAPMREQIQAVIAENINLIKSIKNNYFSQINGAVNRVILNKGSVNELTKELAGYNGANLRRALFIAKDQTHKAWNILSFQKMESAGINAWEWIHGGGVKEPRDTHIKPEAEGGINHSIHKIGEKAYDPNEEREILPGELYGCRCLARPVIILENGAVI